MGKLYDLLSNHIMVTESKNLSSLKATQKKLNECGVWLQVSADPAPQLLEQGLAKGRHSLSPKPFKPVLTGA